MQRKACRATTRDAAPRRPVRRAHDDRDDRCASRLLGQLP